MGKIINTDTPAKRRDKILRLLATLNSQIDFSNTDSMDFKDKVSFIQLSLLEIERSILETVAPWEKREYWIKADNFRAEWVWVGEIRQQICQKIKAGKWRDLQEEISLVEEKLVNTEPMKRIGKENFWEGAFKTLKNTF